MQGCCGIERRRSSQQGESHLLFRAKAPLRVSFAGGGTDVPPFPAREGGAVLNATINRYAFGALRPNTNGKIGIESVDLGLALSFNATDVPAYDGNLDLVKAAIQKLGGQDTTGYDLFLHSDAPPGSGLGSSSTMMVVLVGLFKELKNLPLTDYDTADLAYVIERKHLGIEGGLQDQYAATFGGFNFMEFGQGQVIVNPLRISQDVLNELEHNLLLCYTGTTRRSDRIIEDQMARYERGEQATVEGLRKQKEVAIAMKNALLQRRLRVFAELLAEGWESKKKLSPKVSTERMDEMYEQARRHGALGGKIPGAGGGGYMLFYCMFEGKHKVAEALRCMGAQTCEFSFESRGLQTWTVKDDGL